MRLSMKYFSNSARRLDKSGWRSQDETFRSSLNRCFHNGTFHFLKENWKKIKQVYLIRNKNMNYKL
uniref:Uncharacterized protein n=1 Tax=Arion vulgaris TaxID=1028688 RepID=A0A0B6Y7Y9_9EUPU